VFAPPLLTCSPYDGLAFYPAIMERYFLERSDDDEHRNRDRYVLLPLYPLQNFFLGSFSPCFWIAAAELDLFL